MPVNLGIVGATGLVGEEILTSLNMLDIEFSELRLYGSKESVGKTKIFRDKEYSILEFKFDELYTSNYWILAVDNPIAKTIIDYRNEHKIDCVIIDNSSEFRLSNDVPLVVPEINGNFLKTATHHVIANPNCTTTILVMLLHPLRSISKINEVTVSTYQAASGAGKKGLDELLQQVKDWTFGDSLTQDYWHKQYLFNVFSHNSKLNKEIGYNEEELKIVRETKKILERPDLVINPTCVRVPVLRSHCLSVAINFESNVTKEEIFEALLKFKGVMICDDPENNEFPEAIKSQKRSEIMVGRIRPKLNADETTNLKTWNFFISGDQLLKGAAYNSVQILSDLIELS
jgi:aspartate-semialdehyde dehydrogenase